LTAVVVGSLLWCGVGALSAGLLTLYMTAGTAFAFSGLALVVLSVGWTLGPFKTPMVWSEGALMTYEGNESPDDAGDHPGRRRLIAVPAFAFAAGILLLTVAGLL